MCNIIFIILAFMVSGCVPQTPAPIEFNHDKTFDKETSYTEKNTSVSTVDDSGEILSKSLDKDEDFDKTTGILRDRHHRVSPVTLKEKQENTKTIYHEVQNGETIEQIAENYDQSVDNIAKLNDLVPPYNLKESQIIGINVSSEILNKKNKEHSIRLPKNAITPPKEQQLRFIKPVDGDIILHFGEQTHSGKSNGVNIAAKAGTAIKSVTNGTVVYSSNDAKFGNLVIVKTDQSDLYIAYAYMAALILEKGQSVKQGDIIGYVGSTGDSAIPQLHFAIREGKVAVDPLKYIGR